MKYLELEQCLTEICQIVSSLLRGILADLPPVTCGPQETCKAKLLWGLQNAVFDSSFCFSQGCTETPALSGALQKIFLSLLGILTTISVYLLCPLQTTLSRKCLLWTWMNWTLWLIPLLWILNLNKDSHHCNLQLSVMKLLRLEEDRLNLLGNGMRFQNANRLQSFHLVG